VDTRGWKAAVYGRARRFRLITAADCGRGLRWQPGTPPDPRRLGSIPGLCISLPGSCCRKRLRWLPNTRPSKTDRSWRARQGQQRGRAAGSRLPNRSPVRFGPAAMARRWRAQQGAGNGIQGPPQRKIAAEEPPIEFPLLPSPDQLVAGMVFVALMRRYGITPFTATAATAHHVMARLSRTFR